MAAQLRVDPLVQLGRNNPEAYEDGEGPLYVQ
jgi:hypothetical protein